MKKTTFLLKKNKNGITNKKICRKYIDSLKSAKKRTQIDINVIKIKIYFFNIINFS